MTLDANILLWIQEKIRCNFLSSILIPFTHTNDIGLLWIAVIVILLIFKKTRKAGVLCFISLVLAFLLNDCILKHIVNRTRPFDAIPGLLALVERPHGSSFPSGHTASSFACAVVIFMNTKKYIGLPALVVAILMGFSRLYVGVHYPTDVLAGILLGCTVAILVSIFGNKIIKKMKNKTNKE